MVQVLKIFDDEAIKLASKIIDDGGVIAFPTETVYALAVDAANDKAVSKLYNIKGRDYKKPMSLLVGDIYQAKRVVEFNQYANSLSLSFFPGPITLVLKKSDNNNISKLVNADLDTIGIRMPNHLPSLKLIRAIGRPIVGTSANISGKNEQSLTSEAVKDAFGDQIDLIVDTGITEFQKVSTIVDLTGEKPEILREGVISKEKIFSNLD